MSIHATTAAHAVVIALSALFPSVGRSLAVPSQHDAFTVRAKLIEYACRDAGLRWCSIVHGIAFVESGYRMRHTRAPLAGCSPYGTDDWQQATCAVRAVAAAMRRCSTTARALVRYQYGECAVLLGRRYRRARAASARYVRNVMKVAARVAREGVR